MRGETELALIEEGSISDENDAGALSDEIVKEAADGVFTKWKVAQTRVVNPMVARTPPTHESVVRGRDLFLKSDCKDCHGTLGRGDGASFVNQDIFNDMVFGGNPSDARPASTRSLKRRRPPGITSWTSGVIRSAQPI